MDIKLPAVDLQATQVQTLPTWVAQVTVGPDGRLWCQANYAAAGTIKKITLQQTKVQIASEFVATAPRLLRPRVQLFEAGGRIWFSSYASDFNRDTHWLLGYDGKQWIEHELSPGQHAMGIAQNTARDNESACNLYLQERCWFASPGGVTCYDGTSFTYQQVQPGDQPGHRAVLLLAEPDSKGLVAVSRGPKPAVWRWRDGTWSRIDISWRKIAVNKLHIDKDGKAPAGWEKTVDSETQIHSAAVFGGGVWISDGYVMHFAAFVQQSDTATVAQLVKDLGDDSFAVRETAHEKLRFRGPAIMPQLSAALRQTTDPEVKWRLKDLTKTQVSTTQDLYDLGSYQLRGIRQLLQDATGNVLIVIESVQQKGKDLGGGVVILNHEGKFHFVPGKDLGDGWTPTYHMQGYAIDISPTQVWFHQGAPGDPACLLDVGTGQVLQRFDEASVVRLFAARQDGTLFAKSSPSAATIFAFQPAAQKGQSNTAEPLRLQIRDNRAFDIAADGAVYALDRSGRALQLAGAAWQPVPELTQHTFASISAGRDGVLVCMDLHQQYWLREGKTVARAADQRTLVQQQSTVLRKAFAGRSPYSMIGRTQVGMVEWSVPRILADNAGNLWVERYPPGWKESRLEVWTGRQWIDVHQAAMQAGSNETLQAVLPLEDDSGVYVSDAQQSASGKSFYARIDRDQLILAPAPASTSRESLWASVLTEDGARWTTGVPAGETDRSKIVMMRFNSHGIVESFKPKSRNVDAVMLDRSGNLWMYDYPSKRIWIMRDNKVVALPELSGMGTLRQVFVSDKPDSAYAWTPDGLVHLEATDPAKPADYRITGTTVMGDSRDVPVYTTLLSDGRLLAERVKPPTGPAKSVTLEIYALNTGASPAQLPNTKP
ncbi:MAG: hypothetical protein WD042_15845 [Phycisphaeraceae bacterium]